MEGNSLGPETQITFDFGSSGTQFLLAIPTTTSEVFAGFAGGLCTGSCAAYNSAFIYNSTNIEVTSGTLTLEGAYLSPEPEPTSLILLGTAGLGMIGAVRRRTVL